MKRKTEIKKAGQVIYTNRIENVISHAPEYRYTREQLVYNINCLKQLRSQLVRKYWLNTPRMFMFFIIIATVVAAFHILTNIHLDFQNSTESFNLFYIVMPLGFLIFSNGLWLNKTKSTIQERLNTINDDLAHYDTLLRRGQYTK